MELHQVIMVAFVVSLVLTVFSFGLGASFDDALYLARRPGLLARSLVAIFVVMPLTAVAVVEFLDLPPHLEVVLIALAISPVPPLLPKQTVASGARTPYGLSLLVTVSLLAIIVVPVAVLLLGWLFHRTFAVEPWAIAGLLVTRVILPVVAGLLVRWKFPRVADRIDKPIRIASAVLLLVVALVLVSASLPKLVALVGDGALVVFALFVVVGLLTGHLLGGPRFGERGALSLASACRHPGVALSVATVGVPDQHFGAIVLLYLLVSLIITIPYVKWHRAMAETKWLLQQRAES
jgi:bile acid:Na+ symporter, BASS family